MSYRNAEFRDWMAAQGLKSSTVASYVSNLNAIDAAVGGLDEAISAKSPAGAFSALESSIASGALKYPSDRRSVLRKYLDFIADPLGETAPIPDDDTPSATDAQSYLFRFEREMQVAVRRQLDGIEAGLTAIDDGVETVVPTGKIDILARDGEGRLVVIELKAGVCPGSALEQVLGYSEDMAGKTAEAVRSILIASAFTDRTQAAAKRTKDLKLVVYDYVLTFNEMSAS